MANLLHTFTSRFVLRVCPELQMVEDPAIRSGIAYEIAAIRSRKLTLPRLARFAIYVLVAFPVYRVYSPYVSPLLEMPLFAILPGLVFIIAEVHIERRLYQRDARERLLAMGLAVCMRCGYDLRELQSDRCPECGRAVEADVQLLIRVTRETASGSEPHDSEAG